MIHYFEAFVAGFRVASQAVANARMTYFSEMICDFGDDGQVVMGASAKIFTLRRSQLCRHVIDALDNGLKDVRCDSDQYHSLGGEFEIIGGRQFR